MFKKAINIIVNEIKEDYKYILFFIVLYIVLNFPVNYYITVGGGTSDVSSRIIVDEQYKSKGSFNISYVTQLDGNVMSYLLSYIIPTWEKEDANAYKYTVTESLEDIEFRSNLDLKTVNGTATYWAYKLAKKEVKEVSSKLYVITVFTDEYDTNLKIQDEIKSIDGNHYETIAEYKEYLQTKEKGDTVKIKIIRKDKEQTLTTKLYESNGYTVLGVGLQYVKEYETNPKVTIKFRSNESGPSGGLISTLEMYNQLTKKDLTKGYKIAGTGTIEADGSIGQIGGVTHKVLGAESDDTDYFLVPDGKNYEDAKKYIKDKKLKVKLIKVKSIQDAIEKLEELK